MTETEIQPPANEANAPIYHYCDSGAFQSIIESGSFWLTDLHQTNDAKEGREIGDVIAELLQDLELPSHQVISWREYFDRSLEYFQAFGFCASEEGDLLSQWRGYAEDGTGFAIGLNRQKLNEIARNWNTTAGAGPYLILEKVKYNRIEQKEILRVSADSIKSQILDGALTHHMPSLLSFGDTEETKEKRKKAWSKLVWVHGVLGLLKRYEMKHISFSEEKEWRLFVMHSNGGEGLNEKLKDHVAFRVRRNALVPYFKLKLNFSDLLSEIVVGPKNKTPDYVLKEFLQANNLSHVTFRRSASTYL